MVYRVVVLICVACIASCNRSSPPAPEPVGDGVPLERQVVVYVSTDESIARPILESFSKSTGITVLARYDSENSKATALAAMIRLERDAPRADVFWSGECFVAAQLAQEFLVDPWRSRRADQLPANLRGASGRWYGLAPRVRVLVYDPARTAAADLPKSMLELVEPKWKGQIAFADPRFGTTRGHIGAFARLVESDHAGGWSAWVRGMADNDPLILPGGNAAVVDAVARGEAAIGLTDTDDVYGSVAGGSALKLVALRQLPSTSGAGPMVIPASVALVADAPHPSEANELLSFLLSPQVSQWMHESTQGTLLEQDAYLTTSNAPEGLPLRSTKCAEVLLERVDDPMEFDADELAAGIDGAVAEFLAACRRESRP